MLIFLSSLLIAICLGFLAGLGVGGGSLLLLWLTQIIGLEQPQARIINLLFYLPAALISTFLRKKTASPDKALILPGILCGCLSGLLFSIAGQHLDISLMKKFLGGLFILIGIKEILYRPRNAR